MFNKIKILISFLLAVSIVASGLGNVTVKADEYPEELNAFVDKMYNDILNRQPDEDGRVYWLDRLSDADVNGIDIMVNFMCSPEVQELPFEERINSLKKFIIDSEENDEVIQNLKEFDGYEEWIYRLYIIKVANVRNAAESKPDIFVKSNINIENINFTEDRFYIDKYFTFFWWYITLLNREPDLPGMKYYGNLIAKVSGKRYGTERHDIDAARGFIYSAEFNDRGLNDEEYIKVIYKGFLKRDANANDITYYLDQLNTGKNRDDILMNILYSSEFDINFF